MRLIFIRHARSLGQKNAKNYVKYGDSKLPLDADYTHQSIECGKFLRTYFNETATKKWPLVWTSQFLRAQQTWTGIQQGIDGFFGEKKPTWHIDPYFNEQSFGALAHINESNPSIKINIARILASLSIKLYQKDNFNAKTFMGESPFEKLQHIRNWIDGTFTRDILDGDDDHMIISHGNVMKDFWMHWFHLYDLDTWKKLKTPGNCDVYTIEGERKNWRLQQLYDGEKMLDIRDQNISPIAHIKSPNKMPSPPLPTHNP